MDWEGEKNEWGVSFNINLPFIWFFYIENEFFFLFFAFSFLISLFFYSILDDKEKGIGWKKKGKLKYIFDYFFARRLKMCFETADTRERPERMRKDWLILYFWSGIPLILWTENFDCCVWMALRIECVMRSNLCCIFEFWSWLCATNENFGLWMKRRPGMKEWELLDLFWFFGIFFYFCCFEVCFWIFCEEIFDFVFWFFFLFSFFCFFKRNSKY